ncbi:DMT family transporter [Vibrio sp. TRT 17S01]|uniref:DMT family transporter n=1 Tax=Vibrio sp. TRT 17S01 TaxID=3418505 RepID=UPI003CEDBD36
MLGTLASFCLMAVGARELSGAVSTFQVLFFRSVIGLFVVSVVILSLGNFTLFSSRRMKLHSTRNIFHFAGQYGWFVGIGLLPLAEVFALEFTVPLWTLLIACLFLNEALTKRKLLSIVMGILGVIIIVQPGVEVMNIASLIVLGAAVAYAVSHASTKSLASTEHPLTILFYMCAIQLPIGFSFAIFDWQFPNQTQWLWIVVIGLTAMSAHYCMTKAMQFAEVSTVVTMDFLRLPLIAVVGVLLYSEPFELSLLIGAALMLAGNLIGLYKGRAVKVTQS